MDDKMRSDIRKAFASLKTETTAETVLASFRQEQALEGARKEKPARHPFRFAFGGLAAAVAVVGLSLGLYFGIGQSESYAPVTLENGEEQVAFELLTGASFLDGGEAEAPSRAFLEGLRENPFSGNLRRASSLSEEEFGDIVDHYHENYWTYSSLLSEGLEVSFDLESGSFEGVFEDRYSHKMTLGGSRAFYYDASVGEGGSYAGELHEGAQCHKVLFTVGGDAKGADVEMRIYESGESDDYLEIEYGTARHETAYRFTSFAGGETEKTVEFRVLERKRSYKLELSVEEGAFACQYGVRLSEKGKDFQIDYDYMGELQGVIFFYAHDEVVTYVERNARYESEKNIQ
ncbi:MAG: hypothetical protein LKK13_03345 [Bacilli bacterium]|jgi:hypothetical protein|nr:hypothetical protein [Bacilli bacterium]